MKFEFWNCFGSILTLSLHLDIIVCFICLFITSLHYEITLELLFIWFNLLIYWLSFNFSISSSMTSSFFPLIQVLMLVQIFSALLEFLLLLLIWYFLMYAGMIQLIFTYSCLLYYITLDYCFGLLVKGLFVWSHGC